MSSVKLLYRLFRRNLVTRVLSVILLLAFYVVLKDDPVLSDVADVLENAVQMTVTTSSPEERQPQQRLTTVASEQRSRAMLPCK